MTVDQFVNQYDGQAIDVDGYYGAQCWDLVELYAREVLGVPSEPWAITLGPNGSAREAWTVFDSHMQRYFDKHLGNEKQKGDILVYGYNPDGHIAVCLGGSSVFQENSPLGSKAHVGNNSDNGLLGVLRIKKGDDMLTPQAINLAFAASPYNRQALPEEVAAWTGKDTELLLQTIYNNSRELMTQLLNPQTDTEAVKKLQQIKVLVNS